MEWERIRKKRKNFSKKTQIRISFENAILELPDEIAKKNS
jgi:hypothetical protein